MRRLRNPCNYSIFLLILQDMLEIRNSKFKIQNLLPRPSSSAGQESRLARPPIVVVMGHVDHGKTTLLSYIRKTKMPKEPGEITQTIGAYEITHTQINTDKTQINADNISVNQRSNQRESAIDVSVNQRSNQPESAPSEGRKITFIDTPGHEAFSQMRSRGAKIADLAILVVAADDGVKPQTKEALGHIKAEELPFIVAINKIDKPQADVEKTKNELLQNSVFLEGLGGNISYQLISAKTGQGIDELLDLILLAAELEDLKYEPEGETQGFIISVKSDPRRGLTVGVIVKNGALKIGQEIATSTAKGKIKILENFLGERVIKLEPSSPALIFGFETPPLAGANFVAGNPPKIEILEMKEPEKEKPTSFPAEAKNVLLVLLKADETGSLEALEKILFYLNQQIPEIIIKIIDRSIGNIFENDIKLASGAKAMIIGFRVSPNQPIKNLAQILNVKIISSEIIYNLEKEIKELLKKMSTSTKRIVEILATFGKRKGKQQIIGGRILEGPVKNKESFEIWFNEERLGQGKILNLQSQRKDIGEAKKDQEIGLLVESDAAITIGHHLILLD
ncbi:hypothetical protein COS46_02520 [Candidatus Jorgensenbacteria bacterium CG03_land_8_20_14_0_80_38_39]|nr:MAG: hypothetical protein COS46_02520 [Candidatus Jorgensenbacteria bacterium CG03_land_8_20_14_0_80_38_39]